VHRTWSALRFKIGDARGLLRRDQQLGEAQAHDVFEAPEKAPGLVR
jgi:hypothetical protein